MRDWGTTAAALAVFMLVFAWHSTALAQSINVGSGAAFNVGDGNVDAGCGDLTVSGTATLGSGTIVALRNVDIAGGSLTIGTGSVSLSGNWVNSGTFNPGSGLVSIVDGCATTTSLVTGNSSFYNFSAVTGSGRLLQLAAGSTQTFTNGLTLQGGTGSPLTIRSSTPGTQAAFVLNNGATQSISGVDVADNDASGGQALAPVDPADVDSVDSGNNSNWFLAMLPGVIAEPITTIPLPGLLALVGLLALLSRRSLRNVHKIEAVTP